MWRQVLHKSACTATLRYSQLRMPSFFNATRFLSTNNNNHSDDDNNNPSPTTKQVPRHVNDDADEEDEKNVFDLLNPSNLFPDSSDDDYDPDLLSDDDDLDLQQDDTDYDEPNYVTRRPYEPLYIHSLKNPDERGDDDEDEGVSIVDVPTRDRKLLTITGFMVNDKLAWKVANEEKQFAKILEERVEPKTGLELLEEIEMDAREAAEETLTQKEEDTPDARGIDSFKLLLKRDEELDELDREYKKIVLGGVSPDVPESVVAPAGSTKHEFIINEHHPMRYPALPIDSVRSVDERGISVGVACRKASTCRVFLKPGTGIITINGRDHIDYFQKPLARIDGLAALLITGKMGQYDVTAFANGGGLTGHYGAFRRALALALQKQDPSTRRVLVQNKLLKPDPRKVERKKYGQAKARKKYTFVKR